MSRNLPLNDVDRNTCCEHVLSIRTRPDAPVGLRKLVSATVEQSDEAWQQAYRRCMVAQIAYQQSLLTRDAREETLLRLARRFFRSVIDADGHSAPRTIAECMLGMTPSALDAARRPQRLMALQKLVVAMPGRIDVEFDVAALDLLHQALDAVIHAVRDVERCLGDWRAAVEGKRQAAEVFDTWYGAFVQAARIKGGAAWMNAWIPAFADPASREEPAEPELPPVEAPELAEPVEVAASGVEG